MNQGQIILYNINMTPQPAVEVEATVYYRLENDMPDRNTLAGVFMVDTLGYFLPSPVVIKPLQEGKYYIIRIEVCGCVFEKKIYAAITKPRMPGLITGPSALCPGAHATYGVTAEEGLTYQWAVPDGWLLAGQDNNFVDVVAGTAGGTIRVQAVNAAGPGDAQAMNVTIKPGQPEAPVVTGPQSVCPGVQASYSAVAPNAKEYRWLMPQGWQILSGDKTGTIIAKTGVTGTASIGALALNDCGTSGPAYLSVTITAGIPAKPGAIAGPLTMCESDEQPYSVIPVADAATYQWTVPAGWQITEGQGGVRIVVQAGPAGGTMRVQAANTCGLSQASTLLVNVKLCTEWVENSYTCQQDVPFILLREYKNFSSPDALVYYNNMFYAADHDDTAGNFFKFDPNTLADRDAAGNGGNTTPIGSYYGYCYQTAADQDNLRLFVCGLNSGGLQVLDVKTETVTLIPFGNNGSNFNRNVLQITDTMIIAADVINHDLLMLDRKTLAVIPGSATSLTEIPNYSTYLNRQWTVDEVGTELWICGGIRDQGDIYRYSLDFKNYLGTIVVPAKTPSAAGNGWSDTKYWQARYYDKNANPGSTGTFYVGDIGSSQLSLIKNNKVVRTIPFTNRKDKGYVGFAYSTDPKTSDLYLTYYGIDSDADQNRDKREYLLDRDTGDIKGFYNGLSFFTLVERGDKNEMWGAQGGTPAWSGTGTWHTDGIISKFSH